VRGYPSAPSSLNSRGSGVSSSLARRAGGQRYLARQAIENPGPFLALLGKILPTQVNADAGSHIAQHLLAAKLVSDGIIQRRLEPQPQTIQHEPQLQRLLDAPPPLE
jgi:hypothetical protein